MSTRSALDGNSFPYLATTPTATTVYATATSAIHPIVGHVRSLGPSQNEPTKQYVREPFARPIPLSDSLLVPGINIDLVKDYPMASDTSCHTENLDLQLAPLVGTPHLSRDGGKGGVINGQNVFIFCDTATFSDIDWEWLDFISNSVAIDRGMNAAHEQALNFELEDAVGQWSDDIGRLRGFAPMTTAEQSYSIKMPGGGDRYAVWPGSSLIPLNATHGPMYANLIFDKVDMATQAYQLARLRNTLLVVSTSYFDPSSTRALNQIFTEDELAWGSLGCILSWGKSSPGVNEGKIHVFAAIEHGVLTGRVEVKDFLEKSRYEFWDGDEWTSEMPTNSSAATILDTPIIDFDIIYSPRHLTFIMVYLTHYADTTYYYRYLKKDKPILPSYTPGTTNVVDDDDAINNNNQPDFVVHDQWSEELILYNPAKPRAGKYIYAGSVHAGYFSSDNMTAGGNKMLLSWSEHTGLDAASAESGYTHMTVVVTME